MSERFCANPNNLDVGADLPHCTRYLLARGFVSPGETVVDAACGHGYGSALIGQVAKKVYAMDKDDFFNHDYRRDNVEQLVENFETIEKFPDCDTFISIETIEHLSDPQRFLDKVTDATRKKIIISSPNKPTKDVHEFHLSDVLLPNIQKLMYKYPEWMEYHSILQGYTYMIFFIRKGTKLYEDIHNS